MTRADGNTPETGGPEAGPALRRPGCSVGSGEGCAGPAHDQCRAVADSSLHRAFAACLCTGAATHPGGPGPEPGSCLIATTRRYELWLLAQGSAYLIRHRHAGPDVLLCGQRASEIEAGFAAILRANSRLAPGVRRTCLCDVLDICLSARAYPA